MPMTLVRRPRSAKRLHSIVRDEVRVSYKLLGDVAIKRLQLDIASWEDEPDFRAIVQVGTKQWRLRIAYDTTEMMGKIYKWVDEGTGERAGGEAYEIFPKNADSLHFELPFEPKTVGSPLGGLDIPGIVLAPGLGEPVEDVFVKSVLHPGIEPRHFTESLREYLSSRTRPGGFRSTTEAAIKRAQRKMGVYA